jgi:hypothetical protein
MKQILIIIMLSIFISSCKKTSFTDNTNINKKNGHLNELISKARNTLKANMAIVDYSTLDWDNIQTNEVKSKNPILRLSSKVDKTKFLYYSNNNNNNEVYKWVSYSLSLINNKINGNISIIDMKNILEREINIVNSKVISANNQITSSANTNPTVVTLDEVIVTGYIQQQSFNLLSYWWLFNSSNYAGQYESVESIEEALATGQGGGGGNFVIEPVIIVTIDSVVKILTQPCLNNAFEAISSNKLTNELSKLYQQTFVGLGHVHNLVIKQVPTTFNNYPAQSHPMAGQTSTWEIQLNSGFQGQFTQELWGSMILHELVHGFIQKNNLNFGPTSQFEDAHSIMLDKWIVQIQSALVESFGMSSTNALALSLSGFDEILTKEGVSGDFKQQWVSTIQNKYGINLFNADAIQNQYINKTLGSPCQ